jgi:hypothetical protein
VGQSDNCILLQINSNGGSYEPYYWTAVRPRRQIPGELATAQVGDLWCANTVINSCNFGEGGGLTQNETLKLIQKGANGQWVFCAECRQLAVLATLSCTQRNHEFISDLMALNLAPYGSVA